MKLHCKSNHLRPLIVYRFSILHWYRRNYITNCYPSFVTVCMNYFWYGNIIDLLQNLLKVTELKYGDVSGSLLATSIEMAQPIEVRTFLHLLSCSFFLEKVGILFQICNSFSWNKNVSTCLSAFEEYKFFYLSLWTDREFTIQHKIFTAEHL